MSAGAQPPTLRFTEHAKNRMRERSIRLEWVERTDARPAFVRTSHTRPSRKMAFRRIEDLRNRWLRVVYEFEGSEIVVVTLHVNKNAEKWR